MFGVGGGILFVPTLVLGLGLTQVHAGATSLLAILPTALVGTWRLQRQGLVDVRVAATIGVASIVGVQGGVLARRVVAGRGDPAALRGSAADHRRAARPPRPEGVAGRPWQNDERCAAASYCCSCSQSLPESPALGWAAREPEVPASSPTTAASAWAIRITIPGQAPIGTLDRLRLGHVERRRLHLPG